MTDTEIPQLNLLRQAVTNLDQHEKLALATFLTGTSNPQFQNLVLIPESDKLTTDLAEACELSSLFSSAARIFFAIELLELQIDRDEFDEGDGLPDPDDYDDEENYPLSTRIKGAYRTPDGDEYEESTDNHYGVDTPGWEEGL